jgi:hypothetical protein
MKLSLFLSASATFFLAAAAATDEPIQVGIPTTHVHTYKS